ncbi:zinc finger domain-containing protein [Streptomyces prasinus]
MYRASTGQGSNPENVKAAVQKGAEVLESKRVARRTVTPEERAKRAAQSEEAKDAVRRKGSLRNPYKSANTRAVSPEQVMRLQCPACRAAAGEPCAASLRNGEPAFHLERQQAARMVLWRSVAAP